MYTRALAIGASTFTRAGPGTASISASIKGILPLSPGRPTWATSPSVNKNRPGIGVHGEPDTGCAVGPGHPDAYQRLRLGGT